MSEIDLRYVQDLDLNPSEKRTITLNSNNICNSNVNTCSQLTFGTHEKVLSQKNKTI